MKKFLQDRKRFFYLVAPAVIGGIYLILCFLNINQSISVDESHSLYLTRFDFGRIFNYSAAEIQPPLYYFALKTWAHFLGHSVAIMRILSALFGALTIVFAYLWLKYKYGVSAAILASFLLSISPVFIHFGQSMLPATMVCAVVFAGTFFLQLAVDNRQKLWWIIYAILMVIGLWTSYFVLFAWAAHVVYLAIIYRKKIRQKQIIIPYVAAILSALPLLSTFGLWNNSCGSEFSIAELANYWTRTLFYEQADKVANWLLIVAALATGAILFLVVRYRQKMRMLISLVVLPLALLAVLSSLPGWQLFKIDHIAFSAVTIPVLMGVAFTLFMRECLGRKTKKVSFFKKPYLPLGATSIVLGVTFICGIASIYAKGNYDFVRHIQPTTQSLYSDILVIDHNENLSVIAASPDIYYQLSAYESSKHDVHFSKEIPAPSTTFDLLLADSYFGNINNLDDFLSKRDAILLVGIAPERGYIEFPRAGWRVTTFANVKYSDDGEGYQILKLEKE